jgi:hypothetical protein
MRRFFAEMDKEVGFIIFFDVLIKSEFCCLVTERMKGKMFIGILEVLE